MDIVYVYDADLWCEDCGRDIRNSLIEAGKSPENPDDQSSYDSDDFPKEISGRDLESDSPDHCAAGAQCFNAETLSNGQKIGAWLENSLTDEGVKYVEQAIRDDPENPVVQFWADCYADYALGVYPWVVCSTTEVRDALEEILEAVEEELIGERSELGWQVSVVRKALLY